MTHTEALRLALDALTLADAKINGTSGCGHLYEGDCPDESQPDASDPACPACKATAAVRPAIAAIRAALSAPAAPIVPEGWLPIETAPQDMGAYLFRVNGIAVDGFRDATGKMCVRNEQHEWRAMHGKPTHWMPLPAAPQPGAPTPKGDA